MINDIFGGSDIAAYLLEFDSAHGRLNATCTAASPDLIKVVSQKDSHLIKFTKGKTPEELPWKDLNVELVFECTGAFLSTEALKGYFKEGSSVRKVVVSAPIDDGKVLNVVVGCNDHLITPDMRIVTAASCTTNCAAPIVGAIDKAFGIEVGSINTMHCVTPTQAIMDAMNTGKKNDFRRARSGALNMAPTSTGSAKAIAMIYPHLKGKLDGLAVRMPCQTASITDLVLMIKRDATPEDINTVLKAASDAAPRVLGFETRPLVATDYVNDPRSSIVDVASTKVVAKRLVKIFAWYDNEWGYANRMVDIGSMLIAPSRSSRSAL